MNYHSFTREANYQSQYPLYSFDWTKNSNERYQHIALTSYKEDYLNKIEILQWVESQGVPELSKLTEANIPYPATKLLWDPTNNYSNQRLATSGQYLQLWEIDYNCNQPILQEKLTLVNSKLNQNSLPPLTSFDWNLIDTNLLISSSIDTTCTVWDINKQAVKTQLIAHDNEVYDVKFVHQDLNSFLSVGADGSIRLFDLRSLEHSTIIFEPPSNSSNGDKKLNSANNSLLRLDTCKVNQNLVAASGVSNNILILDMRYPGNPTFILSGHSNEINSINWSPNKSVLLSASDDGQALLWDINEPLENPNQMIAKGQLSANKQLKWNENIKDSYYLNSNVINYPDAKYSTLDNANIGEINYASWNGEGNWFGTIIGNELQGVKLY